MFWNTVDFQTIRKRINSGETNCISLVQQHLKKIESHTYLNAYISVLKERSLFKAEEVDAKISEGRAGILAGMIVAVKDILSMKGTKTTCGSRILHNYFAPYDATAIARLESEDAIVIGKTNMDEFGMGSSNENSAFGPVRNPWDTDRIPGGSSGGSAVSVAAGMSMTALGTDTGGSVRQPASHTGVVGLRPTYGRVSRFGLVAFASSLDTIGCFSRTVSDSAAILRTISGKDPLDSTSSAIPVPDYVSFINRDIKGLKVGLPKEYFEEGLDDEVRQTILDAIDKLEKGGAEIRNVTLPHTEYGIAAYYLICTAEASSNLARFDGVRYGFRVEKPSDLSSMIVQTRSEGFGSEVKRRIMLGTYVLSAGYYDAYYRKAQRIRTLIKRDFDDVLKTCDVIAGPTSPTTAFRIGERVDDPLSMYLSDVYTVTAPLAGLPAVSVPVGKDKDGLPIGIQLTGRSFGEGELLRVASYLENKSEDNFTPNFVSEEV